MAEDLMTYLQGKEASGFTTQPYYSPDGDFLTVFFLDEPYFARRVDDVLTVYLSMSDEKLVGCKIKGVARILETLGRFGVSLEGEELKLSVLFLPGVSTQEDERRHHYERVGDRTRGIKVNRRELQPA
jgi:hypothetical protein